MTRTRRSRAKVVVNAHTEENVDTQSTTDHLQIGQKRTLNAYKEPSPTTAAPQATSEPRQSKRARTSGPVRGRPLQLDLSNGPANGDAEEQRGVEVNNNNKGKRPRQLKRTRSFYPGRDEAFTNTVLFPHPSRVDSTNEHLADVNDGDTEVESETDWLSELPPADPAGRKKTAEVMLVERPIWDNSPVMSHATASAGRVPAGDNVAMSREDSSGSDAPVDPVGPPEPSQHVWPSETDLLLVSGSNKVLLTIQRPLMRAVFQDTFESIRAAMVSQNAFPNVYETLEMIKECLIKAAVSNDRATNIHNRLLFDTDYADRMARLPRARIPLFRGEVKDRCVTLIQADFLALRSKSSVINLVQKQLSDYNYTFPSSSNGGPGNFLPRRTRPYRNIRIINIIRDLYFFGGSRSFAHRFRGWFPVHQGSDGVVSREVPTVMVALVATALYAAIKEWSTGVQKNIEFSTDAFLDVYNGHIDTFEHLRTSRTEFFHLMMADIYRQASAAGIGPSAAPMADLELEDSDMEE